MIMSDDDDTTTSHHHTNAAQQASPSSPAGEMAKLAAFIVTELPGLAALVRAIPGSATGK
jgi:hypothetical protein